MYVNSLVFWFLSPNIAPYCLKVSFVKSVLLDSLVCFFVAGHQGVCLCSGWSSVVCGEAGIAVSSNVFLIAYSVVVILYNTVCLCIFVYNNVYSSITLYKTFIANLYLCHFSFSGRSRTVGVREKNVKDRRPVI